MKLINSLICSVAVLLLATCSNDELVVLEQNEQREEIHTVTVKLNVSRTDFDSSTRAASYEWKDGSKLYLRFHTAGNVVNGTATYHPTRQEWTVSYNGTLSNNGSEQKLEITYFDGETVEMAGNVAIDYNTAIYQALDATYRYESNREIQVSANLKPITGRIRFSGETPNLRVLGLRRNLVFQSSTGTFVTSEKPLDIEDGVHGKSDYIYGVLTDSRKLELIINYDEDYTMTCNDNVLAVGKSGWMNIPTEESHNGWTLTYLTGDDGKGHYWVDLGLPSGNKWADLNIGANMVEYQGDGDISHLYGTPFAWGK